MNLAQDLSIIPNLKAVEGELQTIDTMMAYVNDKTPLKDAILEVKTMSGWSQASIKAACGKIMDGLASVFEDVMARFNEETDASVDEIALEPFQECFDEEIKEQEGLRAASLHVIEMASRVAVALNIPVPAAPVTTGVTKPKKSFGASLKALIIEENPRGGLTVKTPLSWLTAAILKENDPSVQKLALLDNKLTQTKSADALRTFAARFKMSDADLAEVILDVLDDARKQITQSDAISTNVTADYNEKAATVTAILDVRNAVTAVNSYVSGK